jgi:hypothetical protein
MKRLSAEAERSENVDYLIMTTWQQRHVDMFSIS